MWDFSSVKRHIVQFYFPIKRFIESLQLLEVLFISYKTLQINNQDFLWYKHKRFCCWYYPIITCISKKIWFNFINILCRRKLVSVMSLSDRHCWNNTNLHSLTYSLRMHNFALFAQCLSKTNVCPILIFFPLTQISRVQPLLCF